MPIQIKQENGGKLVAVQVTGKLVKAEYERCAPEFDRPQDGSIAKPEGILVMKPTADQLRRPKHE
jgi:hypothetical protein